MKRDVIKSILDDANLSVDEKLNKIMNENGNDIELLKEDTASKYVAKAEYETLKNKYTELEKTNNDYIDELTNYNDLKEKYQKLVNETEANNKIGYLKGFNCKHPELLVDRLDWSKFDKDKKEFETAYFNDIKEKYNDLFSVVEKDYKPKGAPKIEAYNGKKVDELTNEDLRKL